MNAETEIKQYLKQLAKEHPNIIQTKLEKGDIVQKSWSLSYNIDDTEIYRGLGDFPRGAVPYTLIHKVLNSSKKDILKLFEQEGKQRNGNIVVPFSRALELGIGECLEKAILVQLFAQNGRDAFLINGLLGLDGNVGVDGHSYNIVFKYGKPYLVDSHNPLAKDRTGKVTHPYITMIVGIKSDEIQVPDQCRQGRTYMLF